MARKVIVRQGSGPIGPKGEKGDTGDITPALAGARDEAVAAKDAAVTAKTQAEAARDAAQAVGDSNDTIVKGLIDNTSSQTRAALSATYVVKAPAPSGDTTGATDTAAIQPLIDAAQQTSGTVILRAGTYYMNLTTTTMDRQPRIVGQGEKLTKINGTILLRGTPGAFSGGYLADLSFIGTRAAATPFLEIRGAISIRWDRIAFNGTSDIGILFHNDANNKFTEMCAGQAHFTETIKTPIEYRVSAGGNPSFHGCGLTDGSTINQSATDTGPKIKIGADAEPYNAPLSVTMWARTAQPLIRHDGHTTSTFYGDMKIELLPRASGQTYADGRAVIVDPAGKSLPFTGSLSRRGKFVDPGKMILGEEAVTETGVTRVRLGGARVSTQPGDVLWIGPDGRPEWVPKTRTNRATNPAVGDGTAKFSGYSGAAVAQTVDSALGGTNVCAVTLNDNTKTQGFAYMEPATDLAQGQVKTVAFDILSPVDITAYVGGRFGLTGNPGIAEVGEVGALGDVEYIPANVVRRVRRVVTVPAPNSGGSHTHEGLYLRANTVADMPANGTVIKVGNITIEDGSTSGSRFNGSDGRSQWTGTAHQSRTVQYPSAPNTSAGEVAYTPTLTNATVGDGELVGYYSKVGKRVSGSLYFKFGATSTVTGTFRFSLPTDAPLVAGSKRRYQGDGWVNDFSLTQRYIVSLLPFGTTALDVGVVDASGPYARRVPVNGTVPMTWESGDEMLITFEYETV